MAGPASIVSPTAISPTVAAAVLAAAQFLAIGVPFAPDDARPQVVHHRPGGRDHESRHHGQDGRERDGADEGEEEVATDAAGAATEVFGELRRRQVAADSDRRCGARPEQRSCPEPDDAGHDEKAPDQDCCPRR